MNINGLGNIRGIDAYKKTVGKKEVDKTSAVKGDRIELSKEGKALSDYSISKSEFDKSYKIEELKQRINNGTYNVDAKLTAKSIIKAMKEK